MKKLILFIVTIFLVSSCNKVYTCTCESHSATEHVSNTSVITTCSKDDAVKDCQQKQFALGYQKCEVAEAQ